MNRVLLFYSKSNFQHRITDDVSREEVMSVDRIVVLTAVLIHHHGAEILAEELVVGSQI